MRYFVYLLVLLLLSPFSTFADTGLSNWYLPAALSDKNTKVKFEVDSTWHMVHGLTSNIEGNVRLAENDNPQSVHVELNIPVATFNTDWESRDERLREVLLADKYPKVNFSGTGLSKNCTPALVLKQGTCSDLLHGKLTLLGKTQEVNIPVEIGTSDEQSFLVSGKLSFNWAEYGIEDPSILVARVDPVVAVTFEVKLTSSTKES